MIHVNKNQNRCSRSKKQELGRQYHNLVIFMNLNMFPSPCLVSVLIGWKKT